MSISGGSSTRPGNTPTSSANRCSYDQAINVYRPAILSGSSHIADNGADRKLRQAQVALCNNYSIALLDRGLAEDAIQTLTNSIPHVEFLASSAPSGEAFETRLRLFKNLAAPYADSDNPARLIDEARRWRRKHPQDTALLSEVAGELALAAKKAATTPLDPSVSTFDLTVWMRRIEAAQRLAIESLRMLRETRTDWQTALAEIEADPRWDWVLKHPKFLSKLEQGSPVPDKSPTN